MKIGITGCDGLIGWHARSYLHGLPDVETALATRETFSEPGKLENFVRGCDAIIHLAGMNRGEEKLVARTNLELTDNLIEACVTTSSRPHVIFSSSTHIFKNSKYGESKRLAAEKLAAWSRSHGALFTEFILPHVFGEGGKPFYNSAVSTFCYQLANGETPEILVDGPLELLHAGEAAEQFIKAIHEKQTGRLFAKGYAVGVSELLVRLNELHKSYQAQTIPEFKEKLDLTLFNTYRAYLFPQHYPVNLTLHRDARGDLFESVKTLHGGQAFLSTTKPGITRGNHYHRHKLERFCVIRGEATIRLRRLFHSAITEFTVSGKIPTYVDMPTLFTHNITNVGSEELITLFWSHEVFNRQAPDTFAEQVQL
jgi:UDP-2-acetamido-2,6-beta-L-arabino-hexul-4-ose reductase